MNRAVALTAPKSRSASFAFPQSELQVLLHEADLATSRLVRLMRLPNHEHDDLRQELLLDIIVRLKWFKPARGTLGAFIGTVVRNRAKRLANRINRARAIFAPVSLDDPSREAEGVSLGETLAEADGYAAFLGQPADRISAVEQRLDLDRAFGSLRPAELNLCADLIDRTPTEISRSGQGSRAGLYRQVKEIRLRMLMAGISTMP